MRPIEQQTILVTGATSGLGKALAHELASRGATTLVHGRNRARLKETVRELGDVRRYLADLSSLDDVRRLAEEIERDHERLDVLVNNAGIGFGHRSGSREESADAYELRFAVNYLAPFLLARLLERLLVRSAPARIVNVASVGQEEIDFDDVMLERGYEGARAYRRSKVALVLFTFDLAEELADTGVTVNCLHPATLMPTAMVLEAGIAPTSSLEQGLEATWRLVADAELDGVTGCYFNGLREARADAQAYDLDARRRLRELSERLVGLRLATLG